MRLRTRNSHLVHTIAGVLLRWSERILRRIAEPEPEVQPVEQYIVLSPIRSTALPDRLAQSEEPDFGDGVPEPQNPPAHWLARSVPGEPPAHWLEHIKQATARAGVAAAQHIEAIGPEGLSIDDPPTTEPLQGADTLELPTDSESPEIDEQEDHVEPANEQSQTTPQPAIITTPLPTSGQNRQWLKNERAVRRRSQQQNTQIPQPQEPSGQSKPAEAILVDRPQYREQAEVLQEPEHSQADKIMMRQSDHDRVGDQPVHPLHATRIFEKEPTHDDRLKLYKPSSPPIDEQVHSKQDILESPESSSNAIAHKMRTYPPDDRKQLWRSVPEIDETKIPSQAKSIKREEDPQRRSRVEPLFHHVRTVTFQPEDSAHKEQPSVSKQFNAPLPQSLPANPASRHVEMQRRNQSDIQSLDHYIVAGEIWLAERKETENRWPELPVQPVDPAETWEESLREQARIQRLEREQRGNY